MVNFLTFSCTLTFVNVVVGIVLFLSQWFKPVDKTD